MCIRSKFGSEEENSGGGVMEKITEVEDEWRTGGY